MPSILVKPTLYGAINDFPPDGAAIGPDDDHRVVTISLSLYTTQQAPDVYMVNMTASDPSVLDGTHRPPHLVIAPGINYIFTMEIVDNTYNWAFDTSHALGGCAIRFQKQTDSHNYHFETTNDPRKVRLHARSVTQVGQSPPYQLHEFNIYGIITLADGTQKPINIDPGIDNPPTNHPFEIARCRADSRDKDAE